MNSARLLFFLVCLIEFGSSCAADSLDGLKRQRADLERQLELTNARISVLEAKNSTNDEVTTAKAYYIKNFGIWDVDSAGGVEPYAAFYNPDSKNPIKYIRMQVTPFNAVGEVVSSSVGGKTTFGLNFTGPLVESDGAKEVTWRAVWYNSTTHCIRVDSIQITYMNGRTLNFAGKNLTAAFSPEFRNDCTATTRRP